MNKKEFLAQSRKRLSNLPQEEIEERLAFYSEMIDDRMEEGLSETDAVEQMMSSDETVAHLFADEVFQKGSAPSAQKGVKTALLVSGSPLWIALMITAVAVWISLLVAVWSVVVALWAVFVSLAVSAPVALLGGVVVVLGKPIAGLAMLGAGLVCAGLAVFSYYGAKVVTQGCWWLTKKSLPTLKGCFAKKEEAYE